MAARAACVVRKNGQTGRPSVGNGCRFVRGLHRRGRTARIVGAAAGEMDICADGGGRKTPSVRFGRKGFLGGYRVLYLRTSEASRQPTA